MSGDERWPAFLTDIEEEAESRRTWRAGGRHRAGEPTSTPQASTSYEPERAGALAQVDTDRPYADASYAPETSTGYGGGEPPREPPAGGGFEPKRRRHSMARTMHVFGEILLTVGAVLLLFVGYQLWWTGVETQQAQESLIEQLQDEWERSQPLQPGQSPPAPGETPAPGEEDEGLADVSLGDGIGIIRIPRFGPGYAWAVVEGVRLEDLARGPGHYPGSAMPGELGNFAVAGHRATHGEPFAQFESLREGDEVVIETATQWYTYTIYDIQYPVPVTASWAVSPNASQEPLVGEPTRRLMTLTTCHPRWASTYRFLVFTELTNTTPKVDAAGNEVLPPALAEFADKG